MKNKLCFLFISAFFLAGCMQVRAEAHPPSWTSTLPPAPTSTATMTPTPSQTPAPAGIEISDEWTLWNRSPHAGTTEVAQGSGGDCSACHTIGEGTRADGLTACIACHGEVQTARKNAVKTDPAHSALTCIQCHDPHSTTASCSNAGCHSGIRAENIVILATPPGGHPNLSTAFCPSANCHPQATEAALTDHSIHGYRHASVTCTACHDAAALQVGFSAARSQWIMLQTVEVNATPQAVSYTSHTIQAEVDCARCHYEGNPWGLQLVQGDEYGK